MALVEARYNYRLRVSHREARLLQNVFDVNRVVWNTALGRWSDLWKHERIFYSYKVANQELTDCEPLRVDGRPARNCPTAGPA